MTNDSCRCLSCGSSFPPAPPTLDAWDDDASELLAATRESDASHSRSRGVETAAPSRYCSIHCEHYDGLMRATLAAESASGV